MSDYEEVEGAASEPADNDAESNQEEMPTKPLQMSFADWKKCKEALTKPESKSGGQKQQQRGNNNNSNNNNSNNNGGNNNNSGGNNNNGGRKHWSQNNNNNNYSNDNRGFQGGGGGGGGPWNQNRNDFPPLSRPPPLPMQLMGMGMGFGGGNFGNNFGPGPGPCGPGGPMGPGGPCGMGPMGPGPMGGPGPRRNHNQRPLQPPPFWEDMMSPIHRPPPIQPPMPKCPSLWNLVPKERGPQRQNRSNQNNQQQQQQPNKKFKPNNNNNRGNYNNSTDSKLMPPPPVPASSSSSEGNNSQSNGGAQPSKKPKRSGAFIQINGQWIQKPEAPPPLEDAPPGTKEERQRQWKEYRQAMKPFKNREFHNWKRTVQRLGKLPRDQLDEQQLERLQKAEEYIGAHKAMLTVKHAERWVQQDKDETGQVFVRKSPNIGSWDKPKVPNGYQSQPIFGPGRAIKGGSGGMDGATLNQLVTQPPPPPPPLPDAPPPVQWGTTNTGSNSNPSYYSHYSSNFVKGGTMQPS